MKPIYNFRDECPECQSRNTASLIQGKNKVIWCACGCITVISEAIEPLKVIEKTIDNQHIEKVVCQWCGRSNKHDSKCYACGKKDYMQAN